MHRRFSSKKEISDERTHLPWKNLFNNPYKRFSATSPSIGYAVETMRPSSEQSSLLFYETRRPFAQLSYYWSSKKTLDYPVNFYMACDKNKKPYIGRSYLFCILESSASKNHEIFNIWFFDSIADQREEMIKKYAQFHHNEISAVPEIFKKEIEHIGGFWMDVNSYDIKNRIENRRSRSQKSVMKRSALHAFENFFQKNEFFFSSKEKIYWLHSIDKKNYHSMFYPEWCHCYAYSLSRLFFNPQTNKNLAAAPRWFNNAMFVIERVLQAICLWSSENNYPLKISFQSQFHRLDDIALSGEIRARFEHTTNNTSIEIVCPLSSARPLLLTQSSDSLALAEIIIDSLEKKRRYPLPKNNHGQYQ